MGFITSFVVYFFAMCGLIIFALYVYKFFGTSNVKCVRGKNLCVEDVLNLSPRKRLYVVRNGNERFLIASDTERTTLISRLEESVNMEQVKVVNNRSIKKANLSDENIKAQDNISPINKPIMKELKSKLRF